MSDMDRAMTPAMQDALARAIHAEWTAAKKAVGYLTGDEANDLALIQKIGSWRVSETPTDSATVAALKAAHHALTLSHNLIATDKPHAYEDAVRDGEDANGARDAQREVSWVIDNSKELELARIALLAEAGQQPANYDPDTHTRSTTET